MFGKGKARSGEAVQQAGLSPAEDLFSSAAATALAAAADSGVDAKATAPPSTGRRLIGSDIAIQLDELRGNESFVELKVSQLTTALIPGAYPSAFTQTLSSSRCALLSLMCPRTSLRLMRCASVCMFTALHRCK